MLNPFTSRKLRKGLTQKSQLPLCSQIWNTFDLTTQNLWKACGLVCGLTGFRFFVQDKVLRLKNFLSGESTPSLLYQSTVGRLHVESPASSLVISQLHPLTYYVLKKKTGKATMKELVEVVEQFALPLNLYINYKSNLTSLAPTARQGSLPTYTGFYLNQTRFQKITCDLTGHISEMSMTLHGDSDGQTESGQFAIYSDNAGSPGSLLAVSEVFDIATSFQGIKTIPISCDLVSGVSYWFAVQTTVFSTTGVIAYRASVSSTNYKYIAHTTFGDWPTNPSCSNGTYTISIYATVQAPGAVARFSAIIYSSYQGRTIETPADIDFDLVTDWKSASFGIGEVIGLVRGYALFLELDMVTGDVWFDDVQAVHSGQNWVRDKNCNNIRQTFTKQFFQVPAHWVAIDLPAGSYYNSEYGNLP
jgi:hypothetical protein